MLIVIATQEESKLIKEIFHTELPYMVTGVGGLNVYNALRDIPRDKEIINIGYAGSNNLEVGTVVTVKNVHTYHENVDFKEVKMQLQIVDDCMQCDCYTSTDFVTKTKITEPCIFDMELAFICALGFDNIISIKVVSDNLNIKEYEGNI